LYYLIRAVIFINDFGFSISSMLGLLHNGCEIVFLYKMSILTSMKFS